MKKTLLLLLSCFFSVIASAQTEPANFKTGVAKFTKFYNANAADSIFSMFNTRMQAALPIEKTKAVNEQLQTQLGNIQTTEFKSINNGQALYKATFDNGVVALKMVFDAQDKMSGLLVQPYQEKASYVVSSGLTETPIKVNTADATLAGSLILPAKNSMAKVPVVLIIAGSGETDRNGNNSNVITAASYFKLADELGKAGIATLRYDKRGVGESKTTKGMVDLRFEDFVNDAIALIKQLKDDARFSKIIVLGHSEGSLLGMLAAEKEKVNAYVSLAGMGDKANKVITEQYKSQTPQVYAASKAKLDSLDKGLRVSPNNDPMFRANVQSYIISMFKYNPQTEIRKLNIPILILQGTTDIQVSVADAEKLKKAKPNAKLVLLDGMNHALKRAPAERKQNLETYNNPNLPIDAKLVDTVTQFVNQLK